MIERRAIVIGGGLAGSEAAWQLAHRGVAVDLFEMKPVRRSPAHQTDRLAELVCSNSFRSDNPENAIGLLHEELRKLGSLILRCADETRVPAGDALALDREKFSALVTESIAHEPLIHLRHEETRDLPAGPTPAIVSTGPLTSDALAAQIELAAGGRLFFYDAIAPIVAADSLDRTRLFAASRYGKGDGDDYLNLPLTRDEYQAFVNQLVAGEKVPPHGFEEPKYFEGCLPIEVMAERGLDCLAYGPMKPVGLTDPRDGKRPHAVIQFRREDRAGTAYNLVGFQTRLTWPEQRRILCSLPGMENAEFLRMGQVHRNTFIDSPRLLSGDLSLAARPHLFFAGQITGVEGYVESTACGFLVALAVAARVEQKRFVAPPATTALGALYRHITGEAHPPGYDYQPTNVTWGLFSPLEERARKSERRSMMVNRARADLEAWMRAGATADSGSLEAR
jgi:methylenetetrahydrofolate--tRNA-(uracil-5-)-methyltransferase